ncbi:hypothetical protein GAO09_08540 [Rhizobiales bacterium RZME27]|uniref:Uncharacterized protein n=1 Tax=Endobacterium cereale TaxID=2663029 RepID=A0A6A8A443_9HYPH|nr:hypothetical protein [Endobacterium cereale]MQY46102.1 hypothetical protein [Endobacterium cereale]
MAEKRLQSLHDDLSAFSEVIGEMAIAQYRCTDLDEELEEAIKAGILEVSQVDAIWSRHCKLLELVDDLRGILYEVSDSIAHSLGGPEEKIEFRQDPALKAPPENIIKLSDYRKSTDLPRRDRHGLRYGNSQPVPIWAAGPQAVKALADEGMITTDDNDFLMHDRFPGVTSFLNHALDQNGIIEGVVFVVLHEPSGIALVVAERNLEYGEPIWVNARNVSDALIAYERLSA